MEDGQRWRTHSGWLVSGQRWWAHGGVEERRWREGGKDLGGKWFGKKNWYRINGDGFSKFGFFLLLF
jgi:hypothetical protein